MWKFQNYKKNKNKPRVLICDHEAHIRTILQEYLSSVGFSASQAKNGYECIELACLHHPDVILLDLEMPHMDGTVVMRHLRALGIDVPVLLFSAGTGVKPFDSGSAVLQKPFRPKEIAVVLETLLQETKTDKFFIPRRFKIQ
jgi:CheY-like chemotaxis protein